MLNFLSFDVMSPKCDKFYETMQMPLTADLVIGYEDGMMIYDYELLNKRAEEFVVNSKPSYKYKKFIVRVCKKS